MLHTIYNKISIRQKFFFAFILFGLLILTLTYYAIKTIDSKKSKHIYSQLTQEKLIEKKKVFNNFVNIYAHTKLFFLRDELVKNYEKKDSKHKQIVLEKIFSAIVDSDLKIKEIRYINFEGIEKIKVEKEFYYSKSKIISNNTLENKLHNNYFNETIKLNENQIWISSIKANFEEKLIENPINPLLLIATPVLIKDKKVGIIIVSVFMKEFLKNFSNEENFDIYIVDKDEYFILHPNKENNFSKYSVLKHSIKNEFPEKNYDIKLLQNFIDNTIHATSINFSFNEEMILIIKTKTESFKEISLEHKNTLLILFTLILLISIPFAHFFSISPIQLYLKIQEKEKEIEKIMNDLLITKENIHIQENIIITTNGREIESCNQAFMKFFEISSLNEFLFEFNSIKELFIKKDTYFYFDEIKYRNQTWVSHVYENLNGKCTVCMTNLKGSNEKVFKITVNLLESKKDYYVVSLNDITDVLEQTTKLKKIANYDSLTGIYNRKRFDELFEQTVINFSNNQLETSIIMFDIDNFKNINDTYGHTTGDKVIKSVANSAKSSIRKNDILARWGGEEFIIILQNSDKSIALNVAEKIRKEINETQIEKITNISCSFGVYQYQNDDTSNKILENVDKFLYDAKQNGKNRVSFN